MHVGGDPTARALEACPHLRNLVIIYASSCDLDKNEDEFDKEPIYEGIPMMGKLHSLKLYECDLDGYGASLTFVHYWKLFTLLEAISKRMNKELRVKCARVKNLTLPTGNKPDCSYDDYSDYCENYQDFSDYFEGSEDYSEGSSEQE
ncbi:hypothetical protein C2845_PM13G07990 [Panicum miliaceum]|uniref:Uncharacterized protein n=1 Tax=Panicum miliaceum TaxID=4540 RepID=A0A3L6RGJ0_PANMI|nr:hypothetical protein C2845_PM13G07990 [Panicum miliaceum]